MQKIIPAPLKTGDEIRIVAPSRGIKIIGPDSREIARQRFEEMGLKVVYAENAVDDNWDLMGTTEIAKRAADINEAFADTRVKAIFTMIGGFNSNQLLPFLDYELIKKHPKIFCGFSDITALLNGIYAKTGLVTFSGPHFSSFGMKKGFDYTWQVMKTMLFGKGSYTVVPSEEWSDDLWFIDQEKRSFIKNEGYWIIHSGTARGTIIGGNLGTFNLLLGSSYRPEFKKDTILFVENCFESSGDGATFLRELQALAYQPDFKNVKAVLIGRFQKASAVDENKLRYIVNAIPQLDNLPVIGNVDFGHTTPMLTFPIGGACELTDSGINIKI